MKKIFIIPNAITAFGLSCGLFVIFRTSVLVNRDLFSILQSAAILLLIAGIADLADGAVARLIKAESDFGGQFDSLSDSVTFGVAPPLLVLKSLTGEELGPILTLFLIIASMVYTLCGVLRLVRYNVSSKRGENLPEGVLKEKKHFTGLPIPAGAAAAVSASLIMISPYARDNLDWGAATRGWILACVLIILGYFMVSRWKFPSVKALHFRVPSFYLVFATGVVAVFVLYGILDFFAEVFFIVTWLYLLISWSLSLVRMAAGKRSKTLVDFEPDQED